MAAVLACAAPALGAAPEPADPGAIDGIKAGARAERAGDVVGAEAGYRRAWANPADRVQAADALRALYESGRAAPSVDQGSLAAARELLGPAFLLTETRNFVILSDADQAWTRQRAAMLERTRHEYFRVMDRLKAPVYPPEHKLLCVLFNDFDRYRAFSQAQDEMWAEWVAGYYSPRTNRIVFYNDSTSPAFDKATADIEQATRNVKDLRAQAATARHKGQTQYAAALDASAADLEGRVRDERGRMARTATETSAAKTVHEAVHALAFNTGLQLPTHDYPFWLSEGLATCFETDHPDSGAFGPDHLDTARRGGAKPESTEGMPIPLERLVGLTEVPRESGAEADGEDAAQTMYRQSRALFAYLYRYRRPELAGYFQTLLLEPSKRLGPERHRELFDAAFGQAGALERRLKTN